MDSTHSDWAVFAVPENGYRAKSGITPDILCYPDWLTHHPGMIHGVFVRLPDNPAVNFWMILRLVHGPVLEHDIDIHSLGQE